MKRSLIIILVLLMGTASGFAFAPLIPVAGIGQIKPPPRLPAPKPHPPRPKVTVHRRRVTVRRPPPPHKLHIKLPHIKLPRHPGPPHGVPPPPRL